MNKKILTMLFGLLLAVGWTSSASAQTLPEDAVSRYGVKPIVRADGRVPLSMVNTLQPSFEVVKQETGGEISRLNAPKRKPRAKAVVNQNNGQGTKLNAPMRTPSATLSYADASNLKYNWRNPNTGAYGNEVPATEVAKDPYQIYQLLKYVYTEPSFPGPYTNAYTSSGQPEDPVYYGGIAGGWNIPFQTQNLTPTSLSIGDITINTSSYAVLFKSIYVYDANSGSLLTSWTSSGNVTANGDNYDYVLPDGWSTNWYFRRVNMGSNDYVGLLTSGSDPGSLTISASAINYATNVRIVINGYGYESGQTIIINDETWNLPTSQNSHTWYVDGPTDIDKETTPTDVLITLMDSHLFVNSIYVYDARTSSVITKWVASTATLPTGWYSSNTFSSSYTEYDGYPYRNMNGGGTIRIPASFFTHSDSIFVYMAIQGDSEDERAKLEFCRSDIYYYYYYRENGSGFGQTIRFPEVIPSETYKPTEGYTALVVVVKNDNQPYTGEKFHDGWEFTDSVSLINYIKNNIDSVKLLTDGMRIGTGEGAGTVFNCEGTYNKFFFLSKGRARKKASAVYTAMGLEDDPWPSYACEEGPFKYMFEQFSPTTGVRGDEIEDFYSEMIDGHVYNVVHDCASVIQTGHQFSLTGNAGKGSFTFKGMNFFIPDYRLKYWVGLDSIGVGEADENGEYASYIFFDCDGRDMNPYMVANATGYTGVANQSSSTFAVNYAQYNPEHAPKVGIYLLALEATAKPSAGYDPEVPESRNFDITLTWVSSLDEMTNAPVPQVFTIYYIGDDGERHLLDELVVGITNPTNELTLTYPWPQEATSQTFTYVVEGRGTGQYSPFVAWTNEDEVIIPGYDDFLALDVDHIESDFVIDEQRNYYRNFLTVTSENDLNGLSYEDIQNAPNGQMSFDIYRSVTKPEPQVQTEKKIATLTFYDATANTVKYRIDYVEDEEQQRLDYTLKTKEDGQTITIDGMTGQVFLK